MTLRDDYEHWARSFPRRMGEGWGVFLDQISAAAIESYIDDDAMREFAIADAMPNKTLSYTSGVLDLIELYDSTPTKTYEKSLSYTGDLLSEMVLTRMSDSGSWTKKFTYDVNDVLEDIEAT